MPNNQYKNTYFNKNNDVFERLSRPNLKMTSCSKTVSSVGVQTELQFKQNSKLYMYYV